MEVAYETENYYYKLSQKFRFKSFLGRNRQGYSTMGSKINVADFL